MLSPPRRSEPSSTPKMSALCQSQIGQETCGVKSHNQHEADNVTRRNQRGGDSDRGGCGAGERISRDCRPGRPAERFGPAFQHNSHGNAPRKEQQQTESAAHKRPRRRMETVSFHVATVRRNPRSSLVFFAPRSRPLSSRPHDYASAAWPIARAAL